MYDKTVSAMPYEEGCGQEESMLRKVYFFHDIRVVCQTNHHTLMTLLDQMFGQFPVPDTIRGEVAYRVFCYENAELFPEQLPYGRAHTGKVRLLTGTFSRSYQSADRTIEYQWYEPLSSVNGSLLSVINVVEKSALVQLEKLELFQETFLCRYPFLLTLGQLMYAYGFEPFHAAAVTMPGDSQRGALIVGASGSGKTTLSLGCASNGYGLLGDDLVMLRKDPLNGLMSAYTITHEISVRSHSIDLWENLAFLRTLPTDQRDKRYCPLRWVSKNVSILHTSVCLLLFPTITLEESSSVIPLSKARALQELMEQSLSKTASSPQMQVELFFRLSTLVEQAPAYKIAIARDATDGPEIVRALFGGSNEQ